VVALTGYGFLCDQIRQLWTSMGSMVLTISYGIYGYNYCFADGGFLFGPFPNRFQYVSLLKIRLPEKTECSGELTRNLVH
jgi:hypothetical protein